MNIAKKKFFFGTRQMIQYGIPSFVFMVFVTGTILSGLFFHLDQIKDEKTHALRTISVIRANLEGALNSRLLLGRGLVAYISVKQGISGEEFDKFAEKLVDKDPMIRNFSILKQTTIIYAYPHEQNRNVIGVNLADIPAQRAAVLAAIETGKPVVVSSVKLVQGGLGTVCRLPVFISPGSGNAQYWGQVSLVLSEDELLRVSGVIDGASGLEYALYEKAPGGTNRKFMHGSAELFSREPVIADITFPFGEWELAAVPAKGWGKGYISLVVNLVLGVVLGIIISLLIFFWIRSRRRIGQLEGLLPICSNCKSVRNGGGDWEPIETLFGEGKSDIVLSHSLCPACEKKLYADKDWYRKGKENK
jgi:sensor domain CHASE-containing protein